VQAAFFPAGTRGSWASKLSAGQGDPAGGPSRKRPLFKLRAHAGVVEYRWCGFEPEGILADRPLAGENGGRDSQSSMS